MVSVAAATTAFAAWVSVASFNAVDALNRGLFAVGKMKFDADFFIKIGVGVGILLGGWLVAKLVAWVVFVALTKTDFDDKIAEALGIKLLFEREGTEMKENALEQGVSKIVYWLLMMLVIVAVLQFSGFSQAAEPVQNLVQTILGALPHVGKAILILVIAFFAGKILQIVLSKSLAATGLDARFAELSEESEDGTAPRKFSDAVGGVIFWLIIIMGLAGAFEALEINQVAQPISNALNTIISQLPKLAIAVTIVIAGYFFGRFVRFIVQRALHGVGLDGWVKKLNLESILKKDPFTEFSLSEIIGSIMMYFIVLQAIVAALHRASLPTLSGPLEGMINQIWSSLPLVAFAVVIVVAGVIIGGIVRKIVENVLKGFGFDQLLENIGFGKITGRSEKIDDPSEMVGMLVQVGIVMLAIAQALQKLSMDTWAAYVDLLLAYVLQHVVVAFGVIIVGFVISNYVRDLILSRREKETDNSVHWLAALARYTILVFAFTMAIAQLEIAEVFVLISFSLLFGSLCLGIAIAIGLGGKDVAGEVVREQYDRAKSRMKEGAGTASAAKPASKTVSRPASKTVSRPVSKTVSRPASKTVAKPSTPAATPSEPAGTPKFKL